MSEITIDESRPQWKERGQDGSQFCKLPEEDWKECDEAKVSELWTDWVVSEGIGRKIIDEGYTHYYYTK